MTNELRDELAREEYVKWLLNGNQFRTEPKDIFQAGYKSAIDHLTPMMKEMVDNLVMIRNRTNFNEVIRADAIRPLAEKTLASLPACWRENGGV
jgi:hypothetical protein